MWVTPYTQSSPSTKISIHHVLRSYGVPSPKLGQLGPRHSLIENESSKQSNAAQSKELWETCVDLGKRLSVWTSGQGTPGCQHGSRDLECDMEVVVGRVQGPKEGSWGRQVGRSLRVLG